MSKNTISVIIPAYQHAKTIAACLDSILAQTIAPDEIIVVNDGSTDGLEQVLKPYQNRIRLITQANRGSNPTRNRGFNESTGDYIIFCDADVVMQPDMLEKMKDLLDAHPEVSYVYCGFRYGWKSFASFPFNEARLRRMNFIHTTALVRRQHFPGFDEEIKRLQDWDVWLTMLDQGYIGILIDEQLFYVQEDHSRQGISQWRPAFMYSIPWRKIGWMPKSMKKYFDARRVIAEKHQL
ncbi:glycosyltransferase family 2 protein [Patescibacteria group bacterium]|nr:glycosyltransferase family 2 protein [Patescibacteria group bacterium]